ncbi:MULTISPECIES: DNA repair protein RadA [Prochlorococcus]|uniref:DNA repair protein RadA n=1 Tax=Prochlorococcus marinus (strain SARG / CCMP1375 / SS120) TaxID=167539 RepID=Q7VE58_PROMA|nr:MULTISPECIES: DNA repair protein RadA [Prochlorococcus]AAP99201.1 DNA repair protein sms, radA homolog [Prochlorococcus marinus subsp. marinus str. CCMP1375]KGG11531.1 DNA repair protein RadA [Prochlorococcus marinus str. LG]KGG18515.1 DNA repair protein RadA [Prochlorococcus marinus str. SS2]KGG22788.1 DNA repair protein RadA [Prochlorococcus marinus str. SS35]KGG32665.1 DNA repair protein RadA [Prochlorococcus marinus str. SS51]
MTRTSTIYICQTCGAETRQFFGRCSTCGEWNSVVEEVISTSNLRPKRKGSNHSNELLDNRSQRISSLQEKSVKRISSGYKELDRVLGGGLVPGSLVLIGGDPGIGKSTLLLQSATEMARYKSILYITAEESSNQVQLRWNRLGKADSDLHLLAETDLEAILNEIERFNPAVAIIDSIQAIHDETIGSTPGSVTQVRECSAALQRIAKAKNITLLIVGHITKEGMLAGPKVLEHLVDAVLTFEGDRFASHRILRTIKNRFGATNELGVFEMQGKGLIEVNNPSELFLDSENAPGIATIVSCEGTRPLAIDLQALINQTSYPSPRRTATGIETNRLHQILAVVEKHMNIALSRYDCYLAVAGGLAVEEPAADLGIAAAVISSYKKTALPKGTVLIGEIGLGGQLRSVGQMQLRLREAERLGFKTAIIPKATNKDSLSKQEGKIDIQEVSNINEVFEIVLNIKT